MSDNLITGRDIVIVGQQPWDTAIGSNCKNIAMEFARHNRVLYVNSTLDRITMLRHRSDEKVKKRLDVIKHKANGLVVIGNNLWNLYPDCLTESINWIKNRTVFDFLNKANNRKFAQSISAALKQLGFQDIILFNDNDMFRSFYLPDLLRPAVSVYYSRDYMLAVDYWKFHGEDLEPKLIAKSDLCVANSTYLASYCKKYNQNSFYVGQGCDLEMFTNAGNTPLPSDLSNVGKPIIGYVGALQSIRLDIGLLEFIATTKPEWQIVLVGPEDEIFKTSGLHGLNNVHFTGGKPPELLPSYINAFDVCLNPQLVNQVTVGNYPRKIDEYLAMGKPVVATATEAMEIFEHYTYLATNREKYIELISKALTENSSDKQTDRRMFAGTHTWENNVKEIYRSIKDVKKD